MSNIQWTKGAKYWDHAWNPIVGCRKISEGCEHCYAERVTGKFGINGGDFTPQPMAAKNPPTKGVVFAGNMTDLFGEWNTDYDIRYWLGILSTSAINLVLTKRAERLSDIFLTYSELEDGDWIHYGVTAENQARADERIPHLLCLKGVNRWLSLEPLLGPIDLSEYIAMPPYYPVRCEYCGWSGSSENCPGEDDYYTCPKCYCGEPGEINQLINWVVVGAESGPDARECKIEWIESIVEQCRAAGVPVFVKQIHVGGKLVTDINKFPKHLQIRLVPWER